MTEPKPRVVLVDDEPAARKLLRKFLGTEYEVVGEASNGVEALQRIGECSPDLLLTDLAMPSMDGLELIRRVDAEFPDLTVVVVSGYTDMVSLKEAMAAGARDYLTKPLEKEAVHQCLERIMAQRQERAALKARFAERSERGPGAGIWLFLGAGGGDGRTTLLLGLASELSFLRRSVVVVDADLLFGDVAFYLGMPQTTPDVSELLEGEDDLDIEVVDQHLKRHDSGIRVLHAPEDPARSTVANMRRLSHVLDILQERYDYVLVDLPFSLDDPTTAVMDRARLIFHVAAASPAKRKDLFALRQISERLGYPGDKLLTVVTKVPAGYVLPKIEASKLGVVHYIPRDEEVCAEAVERGQPVPRIDSRSELSLAMRGLLAPILHIDPPEPNALPGLLQRLFG